MAGEATLATSAAIIKTQYTQPKVYWIAYKDNPDFATINKKTDFVGDPKVVAIQTEVPTGAGTSISLAQTAANPGNYAKFQVSKIEDFGIARIKGQALRAAKGNPGALLDLWKREMDGILHQVTRSHCIHMWRNGTGSRGQISAASNVATATITLANISEITNFYVGMLVSASQTDGGALRNAGATEKVAAIDRVAGTLTSTSAAWNSVIAALAASDFLYRAGDAANGGTNVVITGALGWVPDSVTATLFWGLNRSTDPVRLGGQRLDGTGQPMKEVIQDALAMASIDGGEGAGNDMTVWMHPRDRANFVKEIEGKVQYTRSETGVPGSKAKVGFRALEFESDTGVAKVMSTINIPRGRCFVTKWDTWAMESAGPAPGILDFDSNDFLRVSNDDSYEVRCGSYVNMTNLAPSSTVNIKNFGQ